MLELGREGGVEGGEDGMGWDRMGDGEWVCLEEGGVGLRGQASWVKIGVRSFLVDIVGFGGVWETVE